MFRPGLGIALVVFAGLLATSLESAAAGNKDACTLIVKSDVESALGEAASDPRSQVISTGEGGAAAVSTCSFRAVKAPGRSVSLMARYAPSVNKNAVSEVRGTLAQMGQVKDVTGVGDTALWVFHKVGPTTSGQLNVFQKGTVYLIVTLGGFADEAGALDASKKIAQAALRRL